MNLMLAWENSPEVIEFILNMLGNKVDEEGFVIEAKTGQRVIDSDGQELTVEDLGLLSSGSKIYVKDNLVSIAEYYEKYCANK